MADYANLKNGAVNYLDARDVVNGDKKHIGDEIVRNCKAFETALREAGAWAWANFYPPENDVKLKVAA